MPSRLERGIVITYEILINGVLFDQFRYTIVGQVVTKDFVHLMHPDGMFRNAEKTYLEKLLPLLR